MENCNALPFLFGRGGISASSLLIFIEQGYSPSHHSCQSVLLTVGGTIGLRVSDDLHLAAARRVERVVRHGADAVALAHRLRLHVVAAVEAQVVNLEEVLLQQNNRASVCLSQNTAKDNCFETCFECAWCACVCTLAPVCARCYLHAFERDCVNSRRWWRTRVWRSPGSNRCCPRCRLPATSAITPS